MLEEKKFNGTKNLGMRVKQMKSWKECGEWWMMQNWAGRGSGCEKKIFKCGRAWNSRRRHGGSVNSRRSRHAHLRDRMRLNLHIAVSHGCSRRCRDPFRIEYKVFFAYESDPETFTAILVCHGWKETTWPCLAHIRQQAVADEPLLLLGCLELGESWWVSPKGV